MENYKKIFKENKYLITMTSIIYSYLILLIAQGDVFLNLKTIGVSLSPSIGFFSFIILILCMFVLAFTIKKEEIIRKLMQICSFICPILAILYLILSASNLCGICFILLCISFTPLTTFGYFYKSTVNSMKRPFAMILSSIISFIMVVLHSLIIYLISVEASFIILNISLLFVYPLLKKIPHSNEDICLKAENKRYKSFPLKNALKLFLCMVILSSLTTYARTFINSRVHQTPSSFFLFMNIAYFLGMFFVFMLYSKVNTSIFLTITIILIGCSLSLYRILLDTNLLFIYYIISFLLYFSFGIYEVLWISVIADMMQYAKNPVKLHMIAGTINAPTIIITKIIYTITVNSIQNFSILLNITLMVFYIVLPVLPFLYNKFKKDFPDMVDNTDEIILLEETISYLKAVGITDKELNILTLLLKNEKRNDISKQLNISQNTVKTYISRIYQKLNIHSKNELRIIVRNVSSMDYAYKKSE